MYIEPVKSQGDGVSQLSFYLAQHPLHLQCRPSTLVVEETDVLLHKGDAELLGRLEDGHVVLAAAGGGNVLDAGAGRAVDVVDEGELKDIS